MLDLDEYKPAKTLFVPTLRIIKIAARAMDYARVCESPIEVMFAAELAVVLADYFPDARIEPQFKWQNWRMDFALFAPGGNCLRVFVECDGAEFHSTDEQIANDRRKDEAAKAAGIHLLRFTGSEIQQNSYGCAVVALEHLVEGKN